MKALKGFTLIEGVLGIAIIGVGLAGLLMAFPTLIHSSLLLDQTAVATNIARETMETIMAQRDCDEPGCGYSATLTSIGNNTYDANPVTGFASYALDTTVLEVDPDNDDDVDDFLDPLPGSGYARVTVLVSFNNGSNSISLATLISDY